MSGITIDQSAYYHTGDGHLTVFGSFQAPNGTSVTVAVSVAEMTTVGAGTNSYTADGTVQSYEVDFQPTTGSWAFGTALAAAVLYDSSNNQLATSSRTDLVLRPTTP